MQSHYEQLGKLGLVLIVLIGALFALDSSRGRISEFRLLIADLDRIKGLSTYLGDAQKERYERLEEHLLERLVSDIESKTQLDASQADVTALREYLEVQATALGPSNTLEMEMNDILTFVIGSQPAYGFSLALPNMNSLEDRFDNASIARIDTMYTGEKKYFLIYLMDSPNDEPIGLQFDLVIQPFPWPYKFYSHERGVGVVPQAITETEAWKESGNKVMTLDDFPGLKVAVDQGDMVEILRKTPDEALIHVTEKLRSQEQINILGVKAPAIGAHFLVAVVYLYTLLSIGIRIGEVRKDVSVAKESGWLYALDGSMVPYVFLMLITLPGYALNRELFEETNLNHRVLDQIIVKGGILLGTLTLGFYALLQFWRFRKALAIYSQRPETCTEKKGVASQVDRQENKRDPHTSTVGESDDLQESSEVEAQKQESNLDLEPQ